MSPDTAPGIEWQSVTGPALMVLLLFFTRLASMPTQSATPHSVKPTVRPS